MTRTVRPRTLRRIASRERQRGYLGLNSYRRLAASALSGPVFFSQLTTSIVPDKAAPGTVPTFTRATTKTFTDWEGMVRTAQSGEACFTGARRVASMLTNTGFAGAVANSVAPTGWSRIASGGTFSPSPSTLLAGHQRLDFTISNQREIMAVTVNLVAGHTYILSAYCEAVSGAFTDSCLHMVGVTATLSASTPCLTSTAVAGKRMTTGSTYICTVSGTATFRIGLGTGSTETGSGSLSLSGPMIEDVTGQSNQNPSEYVSVGVLSAPYQGANVDGVQYFATQNGNTVTNNVVTEAKGAAIAASVLLGYSAWQQSTNLVLQSENFGTTWAAVGTPTRSAAALRCGDVVLDLLSDADAGTLDGYTQTVTFTGDAVKAVSIHFAQGTATTSLVQLQDSTATTTRLSAVITWNGGVPTVTVGTGTLLGVDSLGNGVYRMRVATASLFAANTNVLKVFPASDAIGTVSLVGNAYFGGVQAENNTFVTPYVATTTAAVTRNVDVLTYAAIGISPDVGTGVAMYCETTTADTASASARQYITLDDTTVNERALLWTNNGTNNLLVVDGGVTQASITSAGAVAGTLVKRAARVAPNDVAQFINGASAGTDTSATMPTTTQLVVGHEVSTSQANGTIRNVRIWNRALANAELVQATSS